MSVSFLKFSSDDPLWVFRAPREALATLGDLVPEMADDDPDWDFQPTLTQVAVRLRGQAQGALADGHCLVQGINGTGLITGIAPRRTLRRFGGEPHALIETRAQNNRDRAQEILDRMRTFDDRTFDEQMRSRRLDITVCETENLVFTHFPIWLKTDAPARLSPDEIQNHKQSYIDYTWAMTAFGDGFQEEMMERLCDDIARMSPAQAADRHSIRVYAFDPDTETFVEKSNSDYTLSDFRTCPCEDLDPSVISMGAPGGDDVCEACEMRVCEMVGDEQVCHVVSLKPYACP